MIFFLTLIILSAKLLSYSMGTGHVMTDELAELNKLDENNDGPQKQDDIKIEDDAAEKEVPAKRYLVSSYGWDSDVEGLVKRLNRDDIYVPGFQRKLVWTRNAKSRFIESLILGLPVPTIFLAQDLSSKKLNIVDGQQRLRSLQEYLTGKFSLSGDSISEELKGRYYSQEVARGADPKFLTEADNRALADAVVHAVVIKPDSADNDSEKGQEYNEAIIQIFHRLNSGGKILLAQEIRSSVFHGKLEELLNNMNAVSSWRELFGKPHSRLKDVEAILRYLALLNNGNNYKSPMPTFLDNYMEDNRSIGVDFSNKSFEEFEGAINMIADVRGSDAFKQGGTFVLSRFDAMMTGIVKGMRIGKSGNSWLNSCWNELESDEEYRWSTEEFVNDTNRVKKRLERSSTIFTK